MEHHVLLHNANYNAPSKAIVPAVNQNVSTTNAHRTVSSSKFPDIFRIVPVILSFKGKSVRIFAYLDDGSNLTSLEESVARKLDTLGTIEPLCVKWSFGNREVLPDSRQLTVTIRGINEDAEDYVLNHVRTVKKLMLPTQSITKDWLAQYSHFDAIPISTYENATPQMIIGLEYSKLMVSLDTREGDWSEPLACKTRIGWVVQGPNSANVNLNRSQRYSLNMCECQADDQSLHQLVNDIFSIENLGVKIPEKVLEPKEEARAKNILETTITKKRNHYEVGLLWKADDIDLPNSYYMAKRRLECVESKMKKDPILAQRMRDYIQDFIEKGYIRKLTEKERNLKGPRTWYLPIFPVFNPKKPEKLRVVWDGAAKVEGVSLNSVLLTGPDLLEPLPDVLRRFREKKIAYIGDLKEMFHQIFVAEPDQDSQRFLWHDDFDKLEQEPDEYILTVDSFGLRCSPTTAQFVKNKNAEKFKKKYPDAAKAIIKGHYVDDMLENSHTVDEAAKLLAEVQFVHSHAGFEMRNFISNSKELLQLINGTTECGNKSLEKDPKEIERVLGMYWNTTKDTFTYSLKFVKSNYNSENFRPTKREILRTVMSIFDPLGFLAHFVVRAKIMIQEIWRTRLGWDDETPTSVKEKWIEWLQQLPLVEETHIPRLYSNRMSPQPAKSIQLHLFVDAGMEAYAAVAYFRVEDDYGVDTCIVGAKSKVAPIKPMSVPRLELQGAVLGTRLVVNIMKSHYDLTIEKAIIWCDSRTVLSWLHSDSRKYSQFVIFRVAEILELSCNMEWRWIPSSENVADEATKSKNKAELHSSARWFVGPEFLHKPECDWQFELEEPEFETKEELRAVYAMSHFVVPIDEFIDFNRFSNWSRLVRATAYVLRFVHNAKSRIEQRNSGPFSSEELILAESFIYRKAQYDSFQDELVIIRHNATATVDKQKEFDKNSVIRTCSAYLDENGVMRIMGRIDACTSVSTSTKRPIILDKNHHVTRLIAHFYHKKYKHLNHQTVLNEMRQKYWIPSLRSVINGMRTSCQKCKNSSALPQIPEMAPLPPERLAVNTQAFTYAGVDYFGPILVVVGRSTQKRWGVLFTCLTSRAIHLEVAYSLETSSCIMAVQNFIAHRGQPRKIYSDNGTNFHGADNELREEFKKLDQSRIQEEFTTTEMSWSFIPPKASHMGGAWERMIGIVKKCMDDVISIRHPTDEVLNNLMKLTMNIVNSRPLTYVSLDSPTEEVLTPNHLLFGSSNGMKPPGDFTNADALKNTWKTAQVMADKFWRAFVLQYLPTLVKRPKWFQKVKPLRIGDIVLIVDENFKRNTWPKGMVVEVFKDKAGTVRSGKVRTDLGTFLIRPVSKLVQLDVRRNENTNHGNVATHNDGSVKQIGSVNGGKSVVEHR